MTIDLTAEQRRRAVESMRAYLEAKNPDGTTPSAVQRGRDLKRVDLIEGELRPLLRTYLEGLTALAEFKSRVDGLNKRHEYWGFKGIKGQMYFNMVVNVADDLAECDQELKAALLLPANEEMASSRIKTFASCVRRIGEHSVEAGGTANGRPKVVSIPFFLS